METMKCMFCTKSILWGQILHNSSKICTVAIRCGSVVNSKGESILSGFHHVGL